MSRKNLSQVHHKMNPNKISIISSVLNGDRFIESCILNVIQQNCLWLEHIIIDGGSTDKTIEIIKKYALNYPHIHWVSEQDNGQSDAMNKGIRLARGDIIGFLNVDDFYEPDVINKIVKLLEKLPVPSLIVGNCNIRTADGKIIRVNRPSRLSIVDLLVIDGEQFPLNPSAYFYHKVLHEKIGHYRVDLEYHMDIDFLLRAVQKAHVHYINEILGNYRWIGGAKTYELNKRGELAHGFKTLISDYRKRLSIPRKICVYMRLSAKRLRKTKKN